MRRVLIEDLLDTKHEFKLSDGKTVSIVRSSVDCEVCTTRGEEVETSEWEVQNNDGQRAQVCQAHAQEFLDAIHDDLEKGGIFSEVFGMPKV